MVMIRRDRGRHDMLLTAMGGARPVVFLRHGQLMILARDQRVEVTAMFGREHLPLQLAAPAAVVGVGGARAEPAELSE